MIIMEAVKCVSTHARIANEKGSVRFTCPKCGEYEIVRSLLARKNATPYTCPNCGFNGPN